MIKSTAEMLKKGYLLFPKVLFEEQMKKTKGATGYFDAFILVLTHVNYSTTECTVKHYTFECRRANRLYPLLIGRNYLVGNVAGHDISSIKCMKKGL